MTYLQQVLNRRLGINNEILIPNKKEPLPTIPEPEIKKEEIKLEIKKEEEKPPPKKRNERGAGRKKVNKEEIEKRKLMVIEKLAKGKEEDIQTIKELQESASKEEIKEELLNTKKKLQLLNSAYNYID